jgi:hypothetical protein
VRAGTSAAASGSHGIIATGDPNGFALVSDLLCLLRLMCRSRAQLAAENLFLRKQLACYLERRARPQRTDNASRIALVLLSHLVEWRELLTMVRPDTLVRWHREIFHLFLAREVTTTWSSPDSRRSAATHRGHGSSQSHVG